jgi:hypothetical protein
LEGCCSTIELHPRDAYITDIGAVLNGKKRRLGFAQLFPCPLTNAVFSRASAKKAWRAAAMRDSNQLSTTGNDLQQARKGVDLANPFPDRLARNRLDGGV